MTIKKPQISHLHPLIFRARIPYGMWALHWVSISTIDVRLPEHERRNAVVLTCVARGLLHHPNLMEWRHADLLNRSAQDVDHFGLTFMRPCNAMNKRGLTLNNSLPHRVATKTQRPKYLWCTCSAGRSIGWALLGWKHSLHSQQTVMWFANRQQPFFSAMDVLQQSMTPHESFGSHHRTYGAQDL